MISAFEIGPYRIGLVKYSTDVTTEFHLKDHTTQAQLMEAVEDMDYTGGGTNTHLALEEMVTDAFRERNGARPASSGIPRVNKTKS